LSGPCDRAARAPCEGARRSDETGCAPWRSIRQARALRKLDTGARCRRTVPGRSAGARHDSAPRPIRDDMTIFR